MGFRDILDGFLASAHEDAQPEAVVIVAVKGCVSGMKHTTLHASALDKLVNLGANVLV